MPTEPFLRSIRAAGFATLGLVAIAIPAFAQDRLPWLREPPAERPYGGEAVEREGLPEAAPPPYQSSAPRAGDSYGGSGAARSNDTYRAPSRDGYGSSAQGYGSGGGQTYGGPNYNSGGSSTSTSGSSYGRSGRADDAYRPPQSHGYSAPPPSARYDEPPADRYAPPRAYRPGDDEPTWREEQRGPGYRDRYAANEPYYDRESRPRDGTFSMREIVDTGHGFFGSISQGLASVIEYAFKTQGRPNGYILGEDLGGAFVAGLRYGEGKLYTRDAGTHRVFWQGPSIGYDAGAEGSKVMVLIYNLRDPSDIYQRFGGVAGSAYVVGGVGITFQRRDEMVLAPIRAGLGLRLGANVGYLKYTPRPTWNPF